MKITIGTVATITTIIATVATAVFLYLQYKREERHAASQQELENKQIALINKQLGLSS